MYQYKWPRAVVTVDTVIFTITNMQLKVLLIKRAEDPFKDHWALPGGHLDLEPEPGEDLPEAAGRELHEEAGLSPEDVFLEQLYTFGTPGRDPRGRYITVAYYALVRPDLANRIRAGSDAKKVSWFYVSDVIGETGGIEMAFDHGKILGVAVDRLRGKVDYEPLIARSLLPEEFTQTEFRHVHEIVKGVTYDNSNFNKRFRRMVSDGKIKTTPGKRATAGRNASLYRLKE